MTKELELKARIMLRCFFITYAIMLLWFGLYLMPGNVFYGLMERLFVLTPHESDLLTVFGLTFMKLVNLQFFLIPWIAIKMEPRP